MECLRVAVLGVLRVSAFFSLGVYQLGDAVPVGRDPRRWKIASLGVYVRDFVRPGPLNHHLNPKPP
jgi:hypothetical protein